MGVVEMRGNRKIVEEDGGKPRRNRNEGSPCVGPGVVQLFPARKVRVIHDVTRGTQVDAIVPKRRILLSSDAWNTSSSHRPLPFFVSPIVESELEWFFDRGEVNRREGWAGDPDRVCCAVAYRTIGGWLSAMDIYDARVLEMAYSRGRRPLRLLNRFGRLTTLVVRLAAVEAGWPEDPHEQRRLEQRTATLLDEERAEHAPRSATRYIQPAAGLLRTAIRTYAAERGRGPSMVSTGWLRRGGVSR
jgi:hypothetical protein